MFLFTRHKRREWRKQQYRQRIARLCDVDTIPAQVQQGVVITVMMTQKPDPQRGEPISSDYLNYIRPWWTTVNKVGLQGVILHDGLPQNFISEATTENVSFTKCELGQFPILHQRHFAVRDYLRQSTAEYVLITDVSDVAFKRDPFELMVSQPEEIRLFIGSEKKPIGRNKCLKSEMRDQYGNVEHAERTVVNPGILGGRRKEVIDFLNLLTDEIEAHGHHLINSDMCMVNRVFHRNYSLSEVFTGSPLHSEFRGWQYDTQAAVMHK